MPTGRRSGIAEFGNIVTGISVGVARKYLFFSTAKKAVVYLIVVIMLSLYGASFKLPEDFYFAKVVILKF